jgi:hypothetical protein
MSSTIPTLALAAFALFSEPGSSMTLRAPVRAPAEFIFDGAAWRCEAGACVAPPGGEDQRPDRACRRLVSRYGPVEAFTWQGRALTPDQVAACNKAAGK